MRTGTTISGTLIAVAKQRVDWLLSDPSWTVYELEVLYDFTLEMGSLSYIYIFCFFLINALLWDILLSEW